MTRRVAGIAVSGIEELTLPRNVESKRVKDAPSSETRPERRRRRSRERLLRAAAEVISDNGIDATTISDIAERADVGLGTVYYYFKSKDELALAVMEWIMDRLGARIRAVTENFEDPAQTFAFGIRTVMEIATHDLRWRWLLMRVDVVAEAMVRRFGPYGREDIAQAVKAGRYHVKDIDLVWRQAIWALLAVCVALCNGSRRRADTNRILEEATANILCMVGMARDDAREVARRRRPPLPKEADAEGATRDASRHGLNDRRKFKNRTTERIPAG